VNLSSRDLGGGGQPPLVVLHGLLGSSRNWLSGGAELASHRHVWALDLRNHGRSPHDPEMSYPAMVNDVLGWLDAQGLAAADVMGHSLGGKAAMLLACRHPERVRRLVVVDIAPKGYLSHAHRAEFAAMHELRLETLQSRGEAELRFEARVGDWAMRKFLATNLERSPSGGWRWIINLPAITAALPELERNPLTAEDRFGGPTLFVTGGKSRYVEPADHAVIRNHFPTAEIVELPTAGHNPHMEARAELVRVVQAFLAGDTNDPIPPAV
jgi:esterase